MRTYKKPLGNVLALLAVLSVFVWVALAQDAANSGSCCADATAGKTAGACPDSGVCPVTGTCPETGAGIAGVAIYLDSPAVLLAKAKALSLTAEQQAAIQGIQKNARVLALNALTRDQKAILGAIPAKPLVLGTGSLQACEPGCTKPCCAVKATACDSGCTKPCCAEAEAASAEQTLCPVMNSPIKKTVFVEYQGKKVYFCCPGCEGAFLKSPQKYLSKLPQFSI